MTLFDNPDGVIELFFDFFIKLYNQAPEHETEKIAVSRSTFDRSD